MKNRKNGHGSVDLDVYTDASTSLGVGGHIEGNDRKWFRHQWKERVNKPHIAFSELLGVRTVVKLWSPDWMGMDILIHCDNAGVLEILKRKCCTF